MYCTSRRAEVRSQEEYKPKERRLPSGCFFLQGFTDLILRLKPPRCPSSSFQLTVVVVRVAWLVLGNGQPGSNKQPLWLWISSRPCLEATVSAGAVGGGAGWRLGPDLESC